jgi:hypothetical protein
MLPKTVGGIELKRRRYSLQMQEISSPLFLGGIFL